MKKKSIHFFLANILIKIVEMNNIHNLTVVILTYKTNEKILADCLNSINPKAKVLVVENSNNNLFKENLEKKVGRTGAASPPPLPPLHSCVAWT